MFLAMKTVGTILTVAFALLPWCFAPLCAQQSVPSGDKKVIINKRIVEADGTETTETIVKKGKAAENFDVDKYIKENRADNVQLDVRVSDGDDDDNTVVIKRSNNKNHNKNYHYDYQNDLDLDLGEGMNWVSCDDNRAFLGVEQDSDEDSDVAGLTVEVVRGAAADKAGLHTNDVVLSLNNVAVNEWDELTEIIGKAKPGDKMQIRYSRNGKTAETEATLTKRSEVKCAPEDCKHGFLGIAPNDDNDDDDDDDENTTGVEVEIVENTAAEKAGLQDGDLLLQLNDTDINDWEDVTDFMSYTKPAEKVRITYKRGGKQSTAEAVLGEEKSNAKAWNLNWAPKDIEINIREKDACLGVYTSAAGQGDQRGAQISEFTTESAALEAQMSTGDIITAVNGARVQGHDELWSEIAKYNPGEKVAVEYLRNNQTLRAEATLKTCRDNSNRVMLFNTDETGEKRREFYLGNWEKDDQTRLREHRVITIRRGGEGDAPKVETPAVPDRALKLEGFRAFPNPSQGQVTVEFRSEPLPTVVSLLDISGRQLFREELNAFNGDYSQQFDLSEYAKGTIVIHVQQGEKVFTEQIIVN